MHTLIFGGRVDGFIFLFHVFKHVGAVDLHHVRQAFLQIIETTKQFMLKNAEYLSEEEIAITQTAIDNLSAISQAENKDEIQGAIEKLNEISRPYAERVMDIAISTAMKGKKML